jgi:tetratricopeptide (TPR) repeat protein
MRKARYDKASRGHTLVKALGITLLELFILVSIAGSVPFADIQNPGSNNVSNLNKSDEAIKAYDKAIEINPNDSDVWYNKGLALDSLNKSDEAIKAYDKAIEINPQYSLAWYNKGRALYKLNKFDEAIKSI